MDVKFIIEMIGYLGSALVLVSMLMTSVVKLRIINLTGSIIFAGYALAIHSYPTALMNICLAGINIYHLRCIFKEEKVYTLIKTDINDGYFSYLLKDCDRDIHHWFPEYSIEGRDPDITYLVCCESKPACLFIGKERQPGEVEIILDYALPEFRDTSVGSFLYEHMANEGYKKVIFTQKADGHVAYLEKTGYKLNEDNNYVFDLDKYRIK